RGRGCPGHRLRRLGLDVHGNRVPPRVDAALPAQRLARSLPRRRASSGARSFAAGEILVVALKLTGSFAATTRRHWTAALLTGSPLLALGNGGVVWAEQRVPSGCCALVRARG